MFAASRTMCVLIAPDCLQNLLQTDKNVKILDSSFALTPKPDYQKWKKENFGKFDQLVQRDFPPKQQYLSEHIPSAVYFDIEAASYPSKYERYAFYDPEWFEEYVQLLGVNKDDKIVIYSRGPMGGMLFAGKVYWMFKVYGHKNVSILDGGLDAWKKAGFKVESNTAMPKIERGNWQGLNYRHKLISFEELTEKDKTGKDIFEKYAEYNIIDARPKEQLVDPSKSMLNTSALPGLFIPGTKNFPANEIVGSDGKLISESEIKDKLSKLTFDPSKPTITMCNMGVQASLAATAVSRAYPDAIIKVFNGSMKEVEARAPEKITGKS